jgi:ribosomal protein S18 acetylase RimI-like enzyme
MTGCGRRGTLCGQLNCYVPLSSGGAKTLPDGHQRGDTLSFKMIGKLSLGSVNIEVTQEIQPESRGLIARRLQEYNAPHLGNHPFGNLDVYVRDADGQVVGGLIGEFAFGWLSIHVLWIAEHLRGTGIGTTILSAAENAAIENGCHSASLDTMSFQAPAFYEKRGYVRVGVADGYPGGAQKIYMKKHLTASA